MYPPVNLNASTIVSPQVPTFSPTSIRRPTANLNPLHVSPYHASPVAGTGVDGVNYLYPQQPVGFRSHPVNQYEMQRAAGHSATRNFDGQPDTTG